MAQTNLMCHQHTDLPSKHKKRKPFTKPRPPSQRNEASDREAPSYHTKKSFDSKDVHKNKERCQKCGDSVHVEDFQSPAKNTNVRIVIGMDTSQVFAFKNNKYLPSKGNPRPICYKWELFMLVTNPYAATQKSHPPVMNHFACKSSTSNNQASLQIEEV